MGTLVETDRRRLEADRVLAVRTQARERRALLFAGLLFALIAALAVGVVLALIF
jgi:tetrahydromethanopterin S-methyltransferase subunit F